MASSWVSWSVSGLFSNPPEAELFPVLLRRFPRRNRLATGCMSPCLPGFQRLLLFFPLAGSSAEPASIGGNYWSCVGVNGNTAYALGVAVGGYAAMVVHAYSTGVSVRCVRAREGQAIPLLGIVWFWVL